jgi:hypothetical protein
VMLWPEPATSMVRVHARGPSRVNGRPDWGNTSASGPVSVSIHACIACTGPSTSGPNICKKE